MPEISRYMTRTPYSIPSTSTAATARDVMTSHLIRHLPILDGDKLVGLVTSGELDALARAGVDLATKPVVEVIRRPLTVWGATPLDEAADLMCRNKEECVVVLGGHGVQGIFTANDALRALADLLQRAC